MLEESPIVHDLVYNQSATGQKPVSEHEPVYNWSIIVVTMCPFSAHKSLPGSSIPGDHFPTPTADGRMGGRADRQNFL